MAKRKQKLPRGWTEKRIRDVIGHYENQTEAEALAEDEAARKDDAITMMAVPNELVSEVRELIERRRGA